MFEPNFQVSMTNAYVRSSFEIFYLLPDCRRGLWIGLIEGYGPKDDIDGEKSFLSNLTTGQASKPLLKLHKTKSYIFRVRFNFVMFSDNSSFS